MLAVAHNMLAMNANRQLNINTKSRAKSMEKLSSGYRINRAADDAAGLAISEKMRRQIRGLTQGIANAQDGVSLCQVADGALSEVNDMLHRVTELSVKSANGTNDTSDREAIQEEIAQIIEEIERISETTEFNSVPLFRAPTSDSGVSEISSTKVMIDASNASLLSLDDELSFDVDETGVTLKNITKNISYNTMTWDQMCGNAFDSEDILSRDASYTYSDASVGFSYTFTSEKGNAKKTVIDSFLEKDIQQAVSKPPYVGINVYRTVTYPMLVDAELQANLNDTFFERIGYQNDGTGNSIASSYLEWRNGSGAGWGTYLGIPLTPRRDSGGRTILFAASGYNRDKLLNNLTTNYQKYKNGEIGSVVQDQCHFITWEPNCGSMDLKFKYDLSSIDETGVSGYTLDEYYN